MKIKLADKSDQPEWLDYLEKRPAETHAFSWQWQEILEKTFGHKPFYLIARENNKVVGLFPLFQVKSLLFGNSLSSMPYLNEGGVLCDGEEAFNSLLEKASSLSSELSCKYVELRHRKPLDYSKENLVERQHKVAMRLNLGKDPEVVFKAFPAKLRSQVRRPTKDGLRATVSTEGLSREKSIRAFYQVFSQNMRDLGTPVYPYALFENSTKAFGDKARTIVVWDEEKPVAAGITIGAGNTTEIPWASSLRSYNKKSPNMLLYWEAIKQAILDGYQVFDFGRSNPDSGTLRFKKQWGAEPTPLHWYYKLNGSDAPDVNPNSSKYQTMVKCWQKLPLPLANSLGPILTRWIP